MKKGFTLNARHLRIILSVVLVLVLAGGATGFTHVQHLLKNYVADTNSLNNKADLGSTNLNTLKQLKTYLANHSSDIDLAKRVVAESKSYQYQNDILNDLTNFANKSGVTITQFDFSDSTAQSGGSAAAPAAAAKPSTATPSASTPSEKGASALNTKSVTISIKSPISYNSLLEFMHHIEQNVTKMQIGQVSLARDSSSPRKVSAQTFTIQVYVQ